MTDQNELRERTLSLSEELGEKWELRLGRITKHTIQFEFSWGSEDIPEVDGTSAYLARNYDCIGSSVPGLVRCDDIEEANRFLDLVQAHLSTEGSLVFPDYKAVVEAYAEVQREGWRDAVGAYIEEWCPEDGFPAECDGAPYWLSEELGSFDGADLMTTVGSSTVYGSHYDIPVLEQEGAILINILSHQVGGESEVGLEWIFEGAHLGDLEKFLLLQLLCHDKQGKYAFVRVDLMGGLWLVPTVNNLEFLDRARTEKGFLDYYDVSAYRHLEDNVNEREKVVEAFLDAVGIEARWNESKEKGSYNRRWIVWHRDYVEARPKEVVEARYAARAKSRSEIFQVARGALGSEAWAGMKAKAYTFENMRELGMDWREYEPY